MKGKGIDVNATNLDGFGILSAVTHGIKRTVATGCLAVQESKSKYDQFADREIGTYISPTGSERLISNGHPVVRIRYNPIFHMIHLCNTDIEADIDDLLLLDVRTNKAVLNITKLRDKQKAEKLMQEAKSKGLRAYPIPPFAKPGHEKEQVYIEFETGRKIKKIGYGQHEKYIDMDGIFIEFTEYANECLIKFAKDIMKHGYSYEEALETSIETRTKYLEFYNKKIKKHIKRD